MVHVAHQLGMLIRDPVQIFLHAGQSLFQTQILRLQELTILLELPQREAKLAVLESELGTLWQIRQFLRPLALLHEPIPGGITPLPACSHLHDGLSATQHDLSALFPERGFLLGRLQCLCDFLHFKLQSSGVGLLGLGLSLPLLSVLLTFQALGMDLLQSLQLSLDLLLLLQAHCELLVVTIQGSFQVGLCCNQALHFAAFFLQVLDHRLSLLLCSFCPVPHLVHVTIQLLHLYMVPSLKRCIRILHLCQFQLQALKLQVACCSLIT
mmetsp:Transcript_21296/g.35538  ORF Transcript_21296/g.35538 Transcript_21296/m.35538 type:complete len:267 (+) Transcript_21296:815-1615(+)